MFHQILAPTGSLWSTILLALVPLACLLFMLAGLRITAWLATIIASVITLAVGILAWHAPVNNALEAYLYGALQGGWIINWITFWGLIIFNTLVLTGDFDKFKEWLVRHATMDVRIQTILLAWAFGALLEGLVGFGYPWAVVVPILVGLGITDLEAIRVAALANNAPVSYGALGSPILALAAGKHVYLEKPCSHNPYEGELLIEAVRKHGRIFQMGNQRRSFPNMQQAIREIHDGIIGRAYYGHAWYDNARASIGHGKPAPVPSCTISAIRRTTRAAPGPPGSRSSWR